MATDYAEKEREFVAALAEDTGRDLSAWMAAISATGLAHRNEIIDWLRQSGFTFANASWLERIHHNGGRLVYGDLPPPGHVPVVKAPAPAPEPPPARLPKVASPDPIIAAQLTPAAAGLEPARVSPSARREAVTHAPAALPQGLDGAIAEALLAAKGLRPLAMLALQEIRLIIPATELTADGTLLVMSAPKPYLALLPAAKALRFYGDYDRAIDSRAALAEAAMKIASKAPPPFPSVIVLTDARLVDATFAQLVKSAHERAHG
jgi:hypothetical protein